MREEARGRYMLEVMILAGYTSIENEMARLARCAARIHPDGVQLNTVTRPPCEEFAVGVKRQRLEAVAAMFDPPAQIIADVRPCGRGNAEFKGSREDILATLRRRPCSVSDLAESLNMHRVEVTKLIEELVGLGLVEYSLTGGRLFYKIKQP
jgi:wyosine [tRNA(Phe)-imidazoG37] synthetase (radical SAM superfamily)